MSNAIRFPTLGTSVDSAAVLLAIDDFSLPFRKDVGLYLNRPHIRIEPILTPNHHNPLAPDYLAAHFYGSVVQDNDHFRMWYYPVGEGDQPGEFTQGPMCYAESDDGLTWSRPNLGQTDYKGRRDHNGIALPDRLIEGITLIKDTADPDPARRYKLLYGCRHPTKKWAARAAISGDGLHWTASPDYAVDDFIEQASLYYHQGLYIVNGQTHSPFVLSEGGNLMGRQGYVWVSPDFDHWLQAPAESFALPEPADPAGRGSPKAYDQVHLGVGATSFGNVLVGLYGLWHSGPVFTEISCDLGLVVSNDGLHFREPVKGRAYIAAADAPATPLAGKHYKTNLCQSNGIINVGDETRLYHGRWRNTGGVQDYYGEIGLATLPRDRWGALALYPTHTEGIVWSAPVTIPAGGLDLALNAEGAAGIRVEIGDTNFNLLPNFSGENAGTTTFASGLDCPVSWPQRSLAGLANQTFRLRLHLRQGAVAPQVYAVYLYSRK